MTTATPGQTPHANDGTRLRPCWRCGCTVREVRPVERVDGRLVPISFGHEPWCLDGQPFGDVMVAF